MSLALWAVLNLASNQTLAADRFWPFGPNPKPAILITAFDPFDGAKANQSTIIAEALALKLSDAYDVTFCQLETVFDHAATQATKCLSEMAVKPLYVISMGESGCHIELETRAENWDGSHDPEDTEPLYDNWGNPKFGGPINPAFDRWIEMTISAQKLKASVQKFSKEDQDHVWISESAGNYVCNNTAFLLAHEFQKPESPSYIFIHVPKHTCDDYQKSPERNSHLISTMLKSLPKN